jgi:uncharacterized protein
MARKAIITWGGWPGHEPKTVAEFFARNLQEEGFEPLVLDALEPLADRKLLDSASLLVMNWTMAKIDPEPLRAISDAIAAGLGLAGCHGGLADAFREANEWQFITGGQWVGHPGDNGVHYRVKIGPNRSPITEGITDFDVTSEQYYLHVDPAVKVLATTRFPVADGPHAANGPVDMPVVWTKLWGKGRVFYSSLGHSLPVLAAEPHLTIIRRGFSWAAR